MRLLPQALRSARTRAAVPAALVGTLAASLVGAPAHAADAGSERGLRSAWRSVPLSVPPASYVVAPGDSVSSVAARFGLRTSDVLSWNGLTWSSIIRPGDVLALTPASPAPEPVAAAPAPAAMAHTVAAGETLTGIAARYGVSLQALFDANGMGWASVIFPGQSVMIPGVVAAASIAPAPAPAPAPTPAPAASHMVVAGDTLSAIAAAHGVSLQALFDANGLGGGSIIYPGQEVAIPGASSPPAPAAPAPAPAAPASATRSAALDDEQAANARLIISIGRELGVPDRGIAIALATAMVESWIRNLDWGDRDSLGLYQQRPSTGWGTPDQVRDPDRSIRVFYGGTGDPNGSGTRGLLDIPGWEGLGFAEAAQAVQRSAFPDRYGEWESAAYEWIALHG